MNKNPSKTDTPATVKPTATSRTVHQLTRNVGDHRYGQTFTAEGAKAAGIDTADLREIVVDRQVKPDQVTTRA